MLNKLEIEIPEHATDEITTMFIQSARKAFEELIKKEKYPEYLTQKDASEYLGISVPTFRKLSIPKICLESVERYSRATLDQYCKENEF